MLAPAPPPFAVLVSGSPTPCGVESFARRLAATAGPQASSPELGRGTAGLFRALQGGPALVINLPVVAWKHRVADLVAAAAVARLRGSKLVLVLHEWSDLDWKRRLSYLPLIAAAQEILFSCPEVEAQFRRGVARAAAFGRSGLVPIPPNVARPAVTLQGPGSAALAAERRKGRSIIGQFGSIYPRKLPTALLEVAAALLARGEDPFVVFIGSFIDAGDRVRETFEHDARRLGLTDRVLVTGYVRTEGELFGLFDEVDVFVYSFAEGLTARRGSVYACLSSGRPVVVNAPRDRASFDHHPAYKAALASEQLHLVPHEASVRDVADAVARVRGTAGNRAAPVDGAVAWDAALAAVRAAVRR